MKAYLDSIQDPQNFASGYYHFLPKDFDEELYKLESLEELYYAEAKYYDPDERKDFEKDLASARKQFFNHLREACDSYINTNNMAKKKATTETGENEQVAKATKTKAEVAKEEAPKEQVVKPAETKAEVVKEEAPKQRVPQLVTPNGDIVTHAHVFKGNDSDDWYFTAKINGTPLKPQKASKEDTEAILSKEIKPADLMAKYYPTKMELKKPEAEFKIPATLSTPEGEQVVHKFNVYKEKNPESKDLGKYKFYTQIGGQKMSMIASREDLNAYFDRTKTPKELITKVFGERLHLADHYAQFQLPEAANLKANDIRLMKNTQTNRYEISADLGALGKTSSKEISYNDGLSLYSQKTATKEQLAAKYLNPEIDLMLQNAPKREQVKQQALGI